jgi:serine/threonine protein kinase
VQKGAGSRVGAYEIVSLLGAGGMGEVYRARDTRLGRDVALKLLPDAYLQDRDRRARFEREAQLLTALNHPHIGAIYGLEDSATPALVTELVEGPTLADRISQGRVPVREVTDIARQVGHARAYAIWTERPPLKWSPPTCASAPASRERSAWTSSIWAFARRSSSPTPT